MRRWLEPGLVCFGCECLGFSKPLRVCLGMLRGFFFGLVLVGFSLAAASDLNEVLRTREGTYGPLGASKVQTARLVKIDEGYGKLLAKLRKEKPAEYLVKRDALNEKYTKERSVGAFESECSKASVQKYVRGLRQGFMKSHPDVDGDNVFIWGGANLL